MLLLLPLTINNLNNRCSEKESLLKLKELKINNKKNIHGIHSLKLLDNDNMVGLINNLLPLMRVRCKVIGLDYLIILLQLNKLKAIKLVKQISNL
jgi:hypothetical protein